MATADVLEGLDFLLRELGRRGMLPRLDRTRVTVAPPLAAPLAPVLTLVAAAIIGDNCGAATNAEPLSTGVAAAGCGCC